MAVFKCKMCGGALKIQNGESVAVCEYCGTKQTLPKLDDDRKVNLYDRANHFRRNNDFDKAMGIYEQILDEDNTDAEAYWSLVLCRYGIEYVEDPATRKRVPTVNRAQFTSVFMDEDYKSAIKYADVVQKKLYEAEAKAIDEIQKGILAISQNEEPFDVFICYKESDSNGRCTQDSLRSQPRASFGQQRPSPPLAVSETQKRICNRPGNYRFCSFRPSSNDSVTSKQHKRGSTHLRFPF